MNNRAELMLMLMLSIIVQSKHYVQHVGLGRPADILLNPPMFLVFQHVVSCCLEHVSWRRRN